jgi:hypothetical protein
MLLTKTPVPVLLDVVFVAPITGFKVVAQQTPLAVTVAPPSAVTFPPETAVVNVIPVTAAVVTVGTATASVVNGTSAPYAVPALFVAYARTWYPVPGSNPVMALVKTPVPVPSVVVFVAPITGFAVVAQQTPLAVTVPPPSAVIFPPEAAAVNVIPVTSVVVRVGTTIAVVVKVTSAPYAVPALFVA